MVSLGRVFGLFGVFLILAFFLAPSVSAAQYYCANPYNGIIVTQSTPCTPDCIFGYVSVGGDLQKMSAKQVEGNAEIILNALKTKPSTYASEIASLKTIGALKKGTSGKYTLDVNVPGAAVLLLKVVKDEGLPKPDMKRIAYDILSSKAGGYFGNFKLAQVVDDLAEGNTLAGVSNRGRETILKINDGVVYGVLQSAFKYQATQIQAGKGGVRVPAACKCGRDAYLDPNLNYNSLPQARKDQMKTDANAFCCVVEVGATLKSWVPSYYAVSSKTVDCAAVLGNYKQYATTWYIDSRTRTNKFSFQMPDGLVPANTKPQGMLYTKGKSGCVTFDDSSLKYDATTRWLSITAKFEPDKCKTIEPDYWEYVAKWPVKGKDGIIIVFPAFVNSQTKKADVLFKVESGAETKLVRALDSIHFAKTFRITSQDVKKPRDYAAKVFPYYGKLTVANIDDIEGLKDELRSKGLYY